MESNLLTYFGEKLAEWYNLMFSSKSKKYLILDIYI